jgi:Lon-like protease
VARPSLLPAEKVPGGAGFAGLTRRVRTLIVAGVLFLVLFVLALILPVPYVILSPGPTYNTLGTDGRGNSIIVIDGRTPAKRAGHLNLTTVSVTGDSVSAFEAISGWLQHDEVVVPRAAVYPPGQSQQQTDTQNKADFQQSQDSATAAAFCELGYPKGFGVIDVQAKGPSDGHLHPGDRFVSVAGKPVTSRATLDAALSTRPPGTTVPIVVQRAGATKTVEVKLGTRPKSADTKGGGYLGVVPDTTCLAPFSVDLGLGNQIGGPSAGLMFALGIMDKVGKVDLTKGRFVAGTGTIDTTGTVGPIGGIALKMIAARAKGATVFLAPAGNCNDVRGAIPSGLHVVKVDTLHHAVQDLLEIEQGQPVPAC